MRPVRLARAFAVGSAPSPWRPRPAPWVSCCCISLVIGDRRPGHRSAHRFTRRRELGFVGGDEQQRVAVFALRRPATRQSVGHRVGRRALADALAGMRRRGPRITSDRTAASSIVVGSSGGGEHAIEAALARRVFAQASCRSRRRLHDRASALRALLGEAVERRLSREPIAAGFFVEISGALGQLAQAPRRKSRTGRRAPRKRDAAPVPSARHWAGRPAAQCRETPRAPRASPRAPAICAATD